MMSLPQSDELNDPALVAEVDLARAAASEEAGDEEVGTHVGTEIEGDSAVTHLFETNQPGYHGWHWAVTVASAGPDTDVTVSEVVLLPGPDALVAPDWVPWENRVQAGDLGVGDLLPPAQDDPRLVPAYLASDDPAVEEVAREIGLGRTRVLARSGREDAAARWRDSEFGPRSDMARSAPGRCGTCGFYLPLAGSLRAAFGTCGNALSPADAHVVHVEYGCGAHSEAQVEQVSPVLVANLIYDDSRLDVEPTPATTPPPGTEPVGVEHADAGPAGADAGTETGPGGQEPQGGDAVSTERPPQAEPAAPLEPLVSVAAVASEETSAGTHEVASEDGAENGSWDAAEGGSGDPADRSGAPRRADG